MADGSAIRTRNPAVPGLSPPLTTTCICFKIAPEFVFLAKLLKKSNWVFSGRLGFLRLLSSIRIICFSCLLGPTCLCSMNTADSKVIIIISNC